MNTYIVEDDALKSERLILFMRERFPTSEVTLFGSFQSGLKAVELKVPDLLLLDMTLPTFDRQLGARESRLRPLGGYELLSKLRLKSIKTKVIVVTGLVAFGEGGSRITFEEVEGRCRYEFGSLFAGMIYYQQTSLEWQQILASCIVSATAKE